MAHYYAFCEKHLKCGPDRDTNLPNARELAWADCNQHRKDISGPHGQVYVKLSTRLVNPNGETRYKYSTFMKE